MNVPQAAAAPSWHIVESTDRWYQAVLRFSPPAATESPPAIRRWQHASATELIGWAGRAPSGPVVVLWEVPADPQALLWTLEVIATIHRTNRCAVQLAHVPPHRRAAGALAVQEAGATFLLADLWTLEPVLRRLADRWAA